MNFFTFLFFAFLQLTSARKTNKLFGGERDSHGCLTSAGYTHCNYTDSCIRVNEPCSFIPILFTDSHGCLPNKIYCNYTDTCLPFDEPCIIKSKVKKTKLCKSGKVYCNFKCIDKNETCNHTSLHNKIRKLLHVNVYEIEV